MPSNAAGDWYQPPVLPLNVTNVPGDGVWRPDQSYPNGESWINPNSTYYVPPIVTVTGNTPILPQEFQLPETYNIPGDSVDLRGHVVWISPSRVVCIPKSPILTVRQYTREGFDQAPHKMLDSGTTVLLAPNVSYYAPWMDLLTVQPIPGMTYPVACQAAWAQVLVAPPPVPTEEQTRLQALYELYQAGKVSDASMLREFGLTQMADELEEEEPSQIKGPGRVIEL
jgi:hypothetical protein